MEDRISQWSGLVFSIHFLAGILMMPFWGKVADRVGRKLMTVRAGLSLAVIYFLTGLSTQAWHVVVLRFLNGALSGMIPMSIALIATNTPRELARRYVALLQTAHASGTILGPTIGGVLASLFGVREAFYVSGTAVFVSTLLILALVVEHNKPEPGAERTSLLADFRMALVMPMLLVSMFLSFMASLGSVGIQPVLALHAETLLVSPEPWLTGLFFSLPGLAFVLTATFWVRQLERRGYRPVALSAMLGTGFFAVAAGLVHQVYLFVLLFFLMALFLGALRPVSAAIISTDVDPAFHGRAFGMQQSAFTMGGLLGPMISGTVASSWGTALGLVAVGVLFLLSSLVFLTQPLAHREAPTAPVARPASPSPDRRKGTTWKETT